MNMLFIFNLPHDLGNLPQMADKDSLPFDAFTKGRGGPLGGSGSIYVPSLSILSSPSLPVLGSSGSLTCQTRPPYLPGQHGLKIRPARTCQPALVGKLVSNSKQFLTSNYSDLFSLILIGL